MADIYLTAKQIGGTFVRLIKSAIGGSPAADVRQAWPTGGAPGWKPEEDVCFIRVTEGGDPITRTRDSQYIDIGSPAALEKQVGYTRVFEIMMIFYGANSNDNANVVRDYVFDEESKITLTAKNIFLIPEDIIPRRIPELWQGIWYERTDLVMNFNIKTVRTHEVGYGKSVEFILNNEQKQFADITITAD